MEAVVPFYEADLCALQHLASSIQIHGALLQRIHLYWVSARPMREFMPQLEAICATMNASREIFLREAPYRSYRSGWQGQQIVKLEAAHHVRYKHYLLLDCKNILLRRLQLSDFVSRSGGGRTYLGPCHESHFPSWLASTFQTLSVPSHEQSRICPSQSITPFVMRTETALSLLRRLSKNGSRSLTTVLDAGTYEGATEFMLYSVFALLYDSERHMRLTPDNPRPWQLTIWAKGGYAFHGRSSRGEWTRNLTGVLQRVLNDSVTPLTVAVHRKSQLLRGAGAEQELLSAILARATALEPNISCLVHGGSKLASPRARPHVGT